MTRTSVSGSEVFVGVDVGGTFTDCVIFDPSGDGLRVSKVPSTLEDQSIGVVEAVDSAWGKRPWSFSAFVHGTTVATNAIIERRGSRVALVTTFGFRDVLQLRRRDRPRLYGLGGRYEPVIDRALSFEVAERVSATGEVEETPDAASVERLAQVLAASSVDAVVVSFMNAYANPANEQLVAEILSRELEATYVCAATSLTREFREFERTSTAAINAYVQPLMARYLRSLSDRVSGHGYGGTLWVVQSNGGHMSLELAAEHAVHTVLSGPAAGVVAGKRIAELAGHDHAVTMDMGGTSLDVGVVKATKLGMTAYSAVDFGLPVQLPMVDVHTIGAGGGSIAWIDAEGLLTVGPQSAGARPGPACYGHGGEQPTLTDANAVIGYIGGERSLGSGTDLVIDRDRASAVIESGLKTLGEPVERLATSIVQVAVAKIAGALRLVTVERGLDPRSFALVAFGGAGPLHVCEVMRSVGFAEALVPRYPGVTSALGCLVGGARHDFVQTVGGAVASLDVEGLRTRIAAQISVGFRQLSDEGIDPASVITSVEADMRYAAQTHTIPVVIDPAALTIDALLLAFTEAYEARFGRAFGRADVVLAGIRTTVTAAPADLALATPNVASDPGAAAPVSERTIWEGDAVTSWPVYDRDELQTGVRIEGPAILEQVDSTTVIARGFGARVDAHLNVVISRAP